MSRGRRQGEGLISTQRDESRLDSDLSRVLRARADDIAVRLAPTEFAGKGIVVVAGGSRVFTNAYVLASVLRQTLRCALPIDVWHYGAEELSPAMAAAIEPLGVRLVDAGGLLARTGLNIRDGWQLKSFALLWSRFAEVLLLDADQVPVADPEPLFAWPQYRERGAVFWPDIVDISERNPAWSLLGLTPEQIVSFESGQVLVDKARHRRTLAMAVALNEQAETLYQAIYGDKDTFLLAWKLCGAPFALVPHQPFTDDRCLFQRDFDGAPLFQHRTGGKWSYSGDQLHIAGFVHEAACLDAIGQLRRLWGGRVFNPPARSVAARAVERVIIAAPGYILDIADEGPLAIAFAAHGEIAEGRSGDRQNWFVSGSSSKDLRLCICGSDQLTFEFAEIAPHRWSGRRYCLPKAEATLVPRVGAVAAPALGGAAMVDDLLRVSGFWSSDENGDGGLSAALLLLARLEEGVAGRLDELAVSCDPFHGSHHRRLKALAELVTRDAVGVSPVQRDLRVFQKGYVRHETRG
jgi:hypothetical protein